MDRTRVETALEWACVQAAPDDRVACFDLDATAREGTVVLSGVVGTEHARRTARRAVATAIGAPVTATDVTVLDADGDPVTTAESELPVRAAPDPDAERVTSAVYGAALSGFDRRDGWRRVRTPDGYLGWTPTGSLEPARSVGDGHVLVRDVDIDGSPGRLPAGVRGTIEEATDGRADLALRTGETVPVPADAVTATDGPIEPETAVAAARRYLGTGYRWGGMTTDGIDCSGLVWMAYWQAGLRLPRDTDQQRRLGTEVDRGRLRAGDLLFFPGHVALSLGGAEFIHACGIADEVTVGSLDPDADRYAPERAADFEVAKRVCE